MKLLNVIGFGISGVVCAGLLTACADGRGANSFKSYQYSKEERAQNKAKYDALNKPADTPNQNTPPPDDSAKTGDVGTGSSAPVLAPDPGRGSDQPLFNPEPVTNDAAKPKVLPEPGPANPSGVTDLSARVQDLNVTIEGELGAENPTAKGLIKGITVLPAGPNNARTLTIQAVVLINGEEVYMDAANVPVKFLKTDERMTNMLFTLTKPCDQKPVAVKDLMQAGAKCRDEQCLAIEMILSFKTQGRNANAILVVTPGKNREGKSEWQYFKTNIGTPKTFVNAQKACEAPKPAKPDGDAGTESSAPGSVGVGTSAPAQGNEEEEAKEKAERQAAEAARCAAVEKEGFSCDDSPGEIARMRNARAAAARAEAARKEREKQDGAAQAAPTPGADDAITINERGDG